MTILITFYAAVYFLNWYINYLNIINTPITSTQIGISKLLCPTDWPKPIYENT